MIYTRKQPPQHALPPVPTSLPSLKRPVLLTHPLGRGRLGEKARTGRLDPAGDEVVVGLFHHVLAQEDRAGVAVHPHLEDRGDGADVGVGV